ncbi:MAG: FAD-dependent oxidoreductase [Terriglobales bacterium]
MSEIVVIGGVAAGLSAASRARRVAPKARITVLERGPVAGYGACGLPLVLSGQVPSMEPLITHSTEFFRQQRGIEVRTGHTALEIEPGRRRVRVESEGREGWLAYDQLVLATGAEPRWRPQPEGLGHVFAANTWSDVARLEPALRAGSILRPLVVGGGYIGLEVAEALRARGFEVSMAHAHGRLLTSFDPEVTAGLAERVEAAGVRLYLGARVRGVIGADADPSRGRVRGAETDSGTIACDAVINCAGLRPAVDLARSAGLILGRTGAMAVDDRQQSSQTGILAAGDCAESRHLVTGAAVWIALGGPANRQGRVAGQNAAGGEVARIPGVLGTLAVPLFGLEWGRTGLSEDQARAAGMTPAAVAVTAGDRAGYLRPQSVTLKIIYDAATRRLLGCHMRGAPGTVTGRLNAAALAITARLALGDLEQLDFAYAPTLAPLYEPLLIAAHNARR